MKDLFAVQAALFAAIDPGLPPAVAPDAHRGDDEWLTARADGVRLGATLHRHVFPPDSPDLVWSAAEVWQLFPVIGDTGAAGMDALLRTWCDRMATERPRRDSSCLLTWPSRDVAVAKALLDHGFVPLSNLAVRTTPAPPVTTDGVTVRRAGRADFEDALALAASSVAYAGLVGAPHRENPAALVGPALRRTLDEGGLVWIAEWGGKPVGLAECALIDSTPGSAAAELLPHGRWAYVNNVVIDSPVRGRGIGQALVSLAHNEFERNDTVGSYLYYNPPNPLASVFWPRQGYRPLWTIWETRPATALRYPPRG